MIFDGLDTLLKILFGLSIVGVIALLVGVSYGIYWLLGHVRFM